MRWAKAGVALAAVVLLAGLAPAAGKAAARARERAVVRFTEPVKVFDVVLQGDYVVEHDQAKMDRGEPCTTIYRNASQHGSVIPGKPLVSFHCKPIARPAVKGFRAATRLGPDGSRMLAEHQFSGSVEGHAVPESR